MSHLFQLPSVRGALIQLGAVTVVGAVAMISGKLFGADFRVLDAAFLQALIAAFFACIMRERYWWVVIHLLFLPGALVLHAFNLPAIVFLLGFCVLLGIYGQIFFTRVPYFPTSAARRQLLLSLLPEAPFRLVDLGSGFGGVVLHVARHRPDATIAGVEIALIPWVVSAMRSWVALGDVRFRRGRWNELNFSDFDIVYLYLSPVAMSAVWEKAKREMRPGSLFVSCEFNVPNMDADTVLLDANGRHALHCWRM